MGNQVIVFFLIRNNLHYDKAIKMLPPSQDLRGVSEAYLNG